MVAVLSDLRLRDLDAASPLTGIPLSYGQRALWFLDRLAPGNPAYVTAGAARVLGGLDVAALRRAAAALVARHPALRTTFHLALDGPVQRISPGGDCEFVEEDGSDLSRQALLDRLGEVAFRPFDLEKGPPSGSASSTSAVATTPFCSRSTTSSPTSGPWRSWSASWERSMGWRPASLRRTARPCRPRRRSTWKQ